MRHLAKIPFFILMIMACPNVAIASIVNADSVQVSTISGQSNGIILSSYVYIVSGDSLTLQGSGGYLANTSSITASAFFGDGGHLTGIVSLYGNHTFSGTAVFNSSFTLQSNGGEIIISTSASTNNIDVSPAGAISFSPSLHNSASVVASDYSTTNPSFGPCVTGSTLTITTTGGRVELTFVGTTVRGGNALPRISFLQDGQFTSNLSSSISLAGSETGDTVIGPFNYLLDAPTAGTHSYCITLAAFSGAGTVELLNNSIVAPVSNLFYVKEIK